jgi:hypothetical protein
MSETQNPFTKGHVLRATAKHMRKSIDVSIRKTFARVGEFDGNLEKSREVFMTLSILHQMREQLDEFQRTNNKDFSGE